MKIYIRGLYPCDCRKINVVHYRDYFEANGHRVVDSMDQSDLVLVWSCGFRADYRQNSISVIQELLKTGKRIVVAGCLPGIDYELLKNNCEGAALIKWADDHSAFDAFFQATVPMQTVQRRYAVPKLVDDLAAHRQRGGKGDFTFSDQFLKLFISEGCNCRCTYCSEKLTFPPYHSYPEDRLVAACREVVTASGHHEIMLIADNVGEYGLDIGTTLPQLMEKLFAIDPRIRIGIQNLHPQYFLKYFEQFAAFLKAGRVLHLRLPIQSASDAVLARMERGYTRADSDKVFGYFVANGFNDFSTDVIAGFPGETDDDFNQTVAFVESHIPTYVNLSAFMGSKGIRANSFEGQIPDEVKLERLRRADRIFSGLGIYCNTDFGELSNRRRRLINAAG